MDSDWTTPQTRRALNRALLAVAKTNRTVDDLLSPAPTPAVAPLLRRFGEPGDPPHIKAALLVDALEHALAALSSAMPDEPSAAFDEWERREQLLDMVYRRKDPWQQIPHIMLRRSALKEERAGRPWTIETLHSDPDVRGVQREETKAFDAILRILMTRTQDAAALETHISVNSAVRCVTGEGLHDDYRPETHASPGDTVQCSFIVLAEESGSDAVGVVLEVVWASAPSDHHHVSAEVSAANQGHAPGVVVASGAIIASANEHLITLRDPRHFEYQTNEAATGDAYEWSMPTDLPFRLIDAIWTDAAVSVRIKPTIPGRIRTGAAHAVKVAFMLAVDGVTT